jgi:hypothetical protein
MEKGPEGDGIGQLERGGQFEGQPEADLVEQIAGQQRAGGHGRLRADPAAVRIGAPGQVRDARDVAGTFSGRVQAARLALIDGAAGLVWATRGKPRVVFRLTISGGKITAIDMTADPGRLRQPGLKITGD